MNRSKCNTREFFSKRSGKISAEILNVVMSCEIEKFLNADYRCERFARRICRGQ